MMILFVSIVKKKSNLYIISKFLKKLSLWRIPKILVIHFKRFTFGTYKKEKLKQNLIFKQNLDISNFTK